MAISRYDTRTIVANISENFSEQFEKRNVNFIRHYSTMKLDPSAYEKTNDLIYSYHTWKLGDALHKLAEIHYGDSRLWWVIGLFNNLPTDWHIDIGKTLIIPQPLEKVLSIFKI